MKVVSRLILVSFLFNQTAFAQIGPLEGQVINFTDPGRISEELRSPILQPLNLSGPAAPKPSQPSEPITGAEKIHLKLNKVRFKGNCRYSSAELEAIFKKYYNKDMTLAKLNELVEEVTKKYRNDGYILSRAYLPPQTIAKGVVVVEVVEGYFSKVDITGQPNMAKCLLACYGEILKCSRPLQIKLLERDLLLMNDLPGYTVNSVITPSKTIPSSADLSLVTKHEPINGFFTYDNYGTRYIGPIQIGGALTYNSLLTGGDSNTLRYQTTSRTSELQFVEFDHVQPVCCDGARWLIGGNYTKTHPLFILDVLHIIGRSSSLYTDLSYPILRTRTDNFLVHGMFNYQNVYSNILFFPFYRDRFRDLIVGASYNGSDDWQGINFIALDATRGFNILGAGFHFLQSRPLGRSQFFKANLLITRVQGLQGLTVKCLQPFFDRFSLFFGFNGQYASQPLLATEQFGYGGPSFGRGYDYSEIVGDMGVAGKFELRYDINPEWKLLNFIQLYGFYDAGEVFNRDKQNFERRLSATSTGGGARITFIPNLTGNIFIGKPLTRKYLTPVLLEHNPYAAKAWFQIVLTF